METSRRVDEGLGSQSGANGRGARETVRGKWTGGIWWRITSLFPSSLPPAFLLLLLHVLYPYRSCLSRRYRLQGLVRTWKTTLKYQLLGPVGRVKLVTGGCLIVLAKMLDT